MGTYLNVQLNDLVHWIYLLPFLLCVDGFVLFLLRQARATFTATRHTIHDLRATTTEISSLMATVQEEIQRFSSATDVPCHTDLRLLDAVPEALHEQVRQTVREALTNVARHAYARDVWIDVKKSGKMFDVEIRGI